MPGTHSPISRHLFTLDGSVLTTGGAKNLAKGQFTIVNNKKAGANGAVVITNFAGEPDSTVYEMRLGKAHLPETRTAYNSKPYSSNLFTIKDVVEVYANFPKVSEQKFDELIVGYDGINEDTAISLEEGQTTALDITLSGDPIMFKTGEKKHVVKIHFGKEVGETDQDVVRRVAEQLKEQRLPGDMPITDVVEISVVDSSNPDLVGTAYSISELSLIDEGDSNALARVQRQYPLYKVVVKERMGLNTVYSILHPAASALSDYANVTSNVYIKNCEECIAGYSEIEGGVVYSVTLADDGVDQTAVVDDLPGFVTGSVIRHGSRDGKGLYTVVLDNELTDAEIATYVTTAGIKTTATIELLGTVQDVCSDVDTENIPWTNSRTCYAQVQSYNIQLKDDECGNTRLPELQAAYPLLTIEEGKSGGNGTQTVTLTGTNGTANISLGGVAYLATFSTDLTTTAANFVTAHAAAILADTGLVVTSNAAVITFTGAASNLPVVISNASGNLNGTLSAIDYVAVATEGGCQRVYSTQVITNVVCDDCSNIFLDQFTSEAPEDYDFTSWEPVVIASNEDALMGIRLKGLPFIWYPGEDLRDYAPAYETSVRIEAAGGYAEDTNESFQPIFDNPFSVTQVSRAQDRDNLGMHLRQWENVSRAYFDGRQRHKDNLLAQKIFGEESVLEDAAQYVEVSVVIHDSKYSQGVGRTSDMGITYSIWAPLGLEAPLITYINKLAARAGVAGIARTY